MNNRLTFSGDNGSPWLHTIHSNQTHQKQSLRYEECFQILSVDCFTMTLGYLNFWSFIIRWCLSVSVCVCVVRDSRRLRSNINDLWTNMEVREIALRHNKHTPRHRKKVYDNKMVCYCISSSIKWSIQVYYFHYHEYSLIILLFSLFQTIKILFARKLTNFSCFFLSLQVCALFWTTTNSTKFNHIKR